MNLIHFNEKNSEYLNHMNMFVELPRNIKIKLFDNKSSNYVWPEMIETYKSVWNTHARINRQVWTVDILVDRLQLSGGKKILGCN